MRPAAAAERGQLADEHADHAQRPDEHDDEEVRGDDVADRAAVLASTWWPPYQRMPTRPSAGSRSMSGMNFDRSRAWSIERS